MNGLLALSLLLLSAPGAALLGHVSAPAPAAPKGHATTDWRLEPSFTFDVLCFLNTLSGDEYYLKYYQEEYDKIAPKLTPEAREALASLKHKLKDEGGAIISAFLTLYFSAGDDQTLDDMLATLRAPESLQEKLRVTPYYSEEGWESFLSVQNELQTILAFLKDIHYDAYWRENIQPKVTARIAEIGDTLPQYNIVPAIEAQLGTPLASNQITVYVLYYSQPHGIRITGTRFLTDLAWPFRIVLRNAIHEMMHPPYELAADPTLRATLERLRGDAFLLDKVENHNPSFGYNSLEGFLEEDCVQALEQSVNDRFGLAVDPRKRWTENDDGMHVFAVALYSIMKQENYNEGGESFRDFLVRMIESGKLGPGTIKERHEAFYGEMQSGADP